MSRMKKVYECFGNDDKQINGVDLSVYKCTTLRTYLSTKQKCDNTLKQHDQFTFNKLNDEHMKLNNKQHDNLIIKIHEESFDLFQKTLLYTMNNEMNYIVDFKSKINMSNLQIDDKSNKQLKVHRQFDQMPYEDEISFLTYLLNTLSKLSIEVNNSDIYCDQFLYWNQIGQIIFNSYRRQIQFSNEDLIYQKSIKNQYLNVWEMWSIKSEKYTANCCQQFYNKYKQTNITLGTLLFWINEVYDNKMNQGTDSIQKNTRLNAQLFQEWKLGNILQKDYKKTLNQFRTFDKNLYHNVEINMQKLDYQQLIDKKFGQFKLNCLLSQKSTGKSTIMQQYIKEVDEQYKKILIITSKTSLAEKLYNDFKQFDFYIYNAIKDQQINDYDRLVIQINSLHRINDKYIPDIIIIDEVKDFCVYLTSSHFLQGFNSQISRQLLEFYSIESQKIFLLDADIDNSCIDYFIDDKDNQLIFINSYQTYKQEKYNFQYQNIQQWHHQIQESINLNKKIAIISLSQQLAEQLKSFYNMKFPSLKIAVITSQTDTEQKKLLCQNVNQFWSKLDIVIYSPSITMGISFDVFNYFDQLFLYLCDNSTGVLQTFQMIHRIRDPVNKQIIFTYNVQNIFDNLTESYYTEQIIEQIMQNKLDIQKNEININTLSFNLTNTNGRIVQRYNNDQFLKLYKSNIKQQLMNKQNYIQLFTELLKENYKDLDIKSILKDKTQHIAEYQEFSQFFTQQKDLQLQTKIENLILIPIIEKSQIIKLQEISVELQKHLRGKIDQDKQDDQKEEQEQLIKQDDLLLLKQTEKQLKYMQNRDILKFIQIVRLIMHKDKMINLLEIDQYDKPFCDFINDKQYEQANKRLNTKYVKVYEDLNTSNKLQQFQNLKLIVNCNNKIKQTTIQKLDIMYNQNVQQISNYRDILHSKNQYANFIILIKFLKILDIDINEIRGLQLHEQDDDKNNMFLSVFINNQSQLQEMFQSSQMKKVVNFQQAVKQFNIILFGYLGLKIRVNKNSVGLTIVQFDNILKSGLFINGSNI